MNIDKIINKEKEQMLKKMIKMYPHLKEEKDKIRDKLIKGKKKKDQSLPIVSDSIPELILEKIVVDTNIFYKDKFGNLLDKTTKVVGIMDSSGKSHIFARDTENIKTLLETPAPKLN